MMKFYLDQKLYSAKKASLKHEVQLIDQELQIMFSGYNEKLEQIVDIVTKEMKDCAAVMDEKLFENIKKRCNQSYHTLILETDLSAK